MTIERLNQIEALNLHGPEVLQELINELRRYQKAMDAIYNHNESARVAVSIHFGVLH